MKNLITFSLFFSTQFSFAQNLVPNWSFEDTVACPIGIGNIIDALGWSSYYGTPDYFNSCNNNQAGVPSNLFGYQFAKTGNGYSGFYSFGQTGLSREIIGTQLTQVLVIGQRYFVSFYVSRAVNPIPGVRINIATNKLGVRFSTSSYSFSNPLSIDNLAQVFTDSVISDSSNWTKISGSFIADSTYGYLSFGNFFTDSATSRILFDSLASRAYYYIDDIRVSTDSGFVNEINEYDSFELIKIFPNPARDWIVVEGGSIYRLSLYDILGRFIFSDEASSTSPVRINISDFKKGVYILNIETSKGNIKKKLVIQ